MASQPARCSHRSSRSSALRSFTRWRSRLVRRSSVALSFALTATVTVMRMGSVRRRSYVGHSQPGDLLERGLPAKLDTVRRLAEALGVEPADLQRQPPPKLIQRFCDISLGSAQSRPVCAVEIGVPLRLPISGRDGLQTQTSLI
jgi:hypothetical protein